MGSFPTKKDPISRLISSRTAKRSASREIPDPTIPSSVSTCTISIPSLRGSSVKGNLMGIFKHLASTLATFIFYTSVILKYLDFIWIAALHNDRYLPHVSPPLTLVTSSTSYLPGFGDIRQEENPSGEA